MKHMEFEYLDTARMRLRKVDSSVYAHVFENYTEDNIKAFYGHVTEEDFLLETKRNTGGLDTFNKKCLVFNLIEKPTDKVIGWCGYHTWYTDHDRAELGYGLFGEQYKRKGLMSEALEAVLDYGFNTMNLHRVEALVAPENLASNNSLLKFGFTKEGHLRQHYKVQEIYHDSLVYSLLKSEFKAS